eukprot:12900107-Prorocentrum_lima.AAC.1
MTNVPSQGPPASPRPLRPVCQRPACPRPYTQQQPRDPNLALSSMSSGRRQSPASRWRNCIAAAANA